MQNVSLDFKDADIRNVLKVISLKSGVNIVYTSEVIGTVTVRLVECAVGKGVGYDTENSGFGYEWLSDKIIMVSTLQKLSQQRKDQQEAAEMEPVASEAFVLSFSKAEEIKGVIEKLITSRGKITVENRTNTLIVTDTKSNLMNIGKIIKSLDKVTPQVSIEVKIIETALGSTERLGVDWSMRIAAAMSKRPITFPFTDKIKGTGEKFFPKTTVPSSLERISTTVTDSTGNVTTTQSEQTFHSLVPGFPDVSTSEFAFGTLDFSQFKVMLEVLDARSDTKLISSPRITTLNNEEAKILVGKIIPIPKYEYSKETGTQVISGYQDKEVGVKLIVTPNINDQEYITLSIKPSVDEVIGSTGPNGERPIISTRSAEATVMIKDGQTLVMGGLISENKIDSKKDVPGLGKIPFIGALFRYKTKSADKTELIIFITPHIIHTSKDFEADLKKHGIIE